MLITIDKLFAKTAYETVELKPVYRVVVEDKQNQVIKFQAHLVSSDNTTKLSKRIGRGNTLVVDVLVHADCSHESSMTKVVIAEHSHHVEVSNKRAFAPKKLARLLGGELKILGFTLNAIRTNAPKRDNCDVLNFGNMSWAPQFVKKIDAESNLSISRGGKEQYYMHPRSAC